MKKTRLDHVAKVEISGVDKKTKPGQKIVRLCNFTDVYYNWAITQDMHDTFMVASASQKEIDSLSLQKGQVALTKDSETRDDIGISTYIADDFEDVVLGYHTALITPDETKLNGKYLNAFLHTSYMQKYFSFNASGSGQRYTLSTEALNAIQLILPTLEEQERIGNLFSLLDRKISLNRSINEELERMAKEIYDYWFVQFEFPDANGRPYKSSGGKMVYNPVLKREVSEGWEVKRLSSVCDIFNGATPSTKDESNYGGDIIWITPKDLSDQKSKFTFHGERNITQKGFSSCSTHMLPKGTILMSSRAPIGLVSIASNELCTNQGFKNLVPKEIIDNAYLYYYIKMHIKQIEQLGTGTTFKEVSREDLVKFPILYISNRNLYKKWYSFVKPIFDKQSTLCQEIEELTKQRDELLPLLMNGQVEV